MSPAIVDHTARSGEFRIVAIDDSAHPSSVPLQRPAKIPPREQWLWDNPKVIGAIERGRAQAARGEVYFLGSFTDDADLEIDD